MLKNYYNDRRGSSDANKFKNFGAESENLNGEYVTNVNLRTKLVYGDGNYVEGEIDCAQKHT